MEQRTTTMKKLVSIFTISLFLSGCSIHATVDTDTASNSNDDVNDQVSLGDSKQEVLDLLTPDYDLAMKVRYLKDAEKYVPDGSVIEIYYMRSAANPDDPASNDEITPYMFLDDKLTGVGWDVVDGPKMQASEKE
jgi:hypothetical protein